MSAEAEKAPEVAKEEEKTSEELKATKRAAEVSKTELRPAWALPQKTLIRLNIEGIPAVFGHVSRFAIHTSPSSFPFDESSLANRGNWHFSASIHLRDF